mmetsp:Transcript_12797/g.31236  ORF Transcript_12797/g.31236 Transcript_12797/m.31236 type:complete len:293 (-) Transcript_12797:1100-1978(-)
MHLIVLTLREISLLHLSGATVDRLALEIAKTLVAPRVLLVGCDVKVSVATDALRGTVEPIAEEDGGLEVELFTSTEATCLDLLRILGVLLVKLLHELFEVRLKLLLELLRHLVDDRAFLVVLHGVLERKPDIATKVFKGVVGSCIDRLLDGAQIHGLLDDFEVVVQSQLDRVDGRGKDPAMLVILQPLEDLEALALQLCGQQFGELFQGLDVCLDLVGREAFKERAVVSRAGIGLGRSLPLRDPRGAGDGRSLVGFDLRADARGLRLRRCRDTGRRVVGGHAVQRRPLLRGH